MVLTRRLFQVGSSFELAQRLDDPIDISTLSPSSQSRDDATPMHVFDIRRSNSVTELWKNIERRSAMLRASAEAPEPQKSSNAVEGHAAESGAQNLEGNGPSNQQDEPQPLLAAFEAEMAKIMESSAAQTGEESSPNPPTDAPEDRPADSNSSHHPRPGEVLTQALQNLAGGVESLGSELKSRIPELERRLSYAQRVFPEHVGPTFQAALTTLDSHVKNLANIVHDASIATGHAADRVRQAELRSAEQVVDGLGKMVGEVGQIGRTLFAAFEAEFGRRSSSTQTETPNQATTSTSQEEQRQGAPIDEKKEPAADATSSATAGCATTAHSDVDSGTGTSSKLASPDPSKQTGASSQLSDVIPENQTPVPAPPPPETRPLPIRTCTWPNRSAQVPPVPPSPTHEPTLNNHVERSPQEPTSQNSHDGAVQSQPSSESSKAVKDSLFIGNVGFNVTEKMIEDVFASKGFLAKVHLPTDCVTGKHAGFGYAHFRSTHSARAALEALQGAHIDGHSINLEFSDNSPIDTLQSPEHVSDGGPKPPTASAEGPSSSQRLRHRQSWHPASQRTEQIDSRRVSFMDRLNAVSPRPATSSKDGQPGIHNDDPGALLDQSEESAEFAARYPSLLPSSDAQSSTAASPDRLLTLSPNSEMARFPPVSQLDAHILASQYRFARPKPSADSRVDDNKDRQPFSQPRPENVSVTSVQERQQASEQPRVPMESRPETQGLQTDTPYQHGRGRLRRSRPMMPAAPSARLTSPFNPLVPHMAPARPLRRSATEVHSLRNRTRENPTATRPLSFFEREQDRAIPGSFPADEPAPVASGEFASDRDMQIAIKQSIIDNCVDTLVSLGYGTELDGGRQRLRVYAEAVGGKVADAIDMIEEDRAAYARHDSSTL